MIPEKPTPEKPWWDHCLSMLVLLTLPAFILFTPWLLSSLYIARTLSSSVPKTRKFYKTLLIITISSPFLFLSQQVFSFMTYSPYNDPKVARGSLMGRAEANIGNVVRLQSGYVLRNKTFAKTFDEILMDDLTESRNTEGGYQYKMAVVSKDLALVGAKPLIREVRGYNGATWKYKNAKGLTVAAIIICKSRKFDVDGTEPSSLPLVNASRKLSCAPDWTTVYSEAE
jgi:Type IV pilin-like G and H, putative